jgi:hypothetical protein
MQGSSPYPLPDDSGRGLGRGGLLGVKTNMTLHGSPPERANFGNSSGQVRLIGEGHFCSFMNYLQPFWKFENRASHEDTERG